MKKKTNNKLESNIAFIDWQNLHLWTQSDGRSVDIKKFRIYLKDKFKIQEAYYFLWFLSEDQQELYSSLQKAGFIIIFRKHTELLKWKKKWNVDVDIVFSIMKRIIDKSKKIEDSNFDKIVLVSWDGDYIKLVNYLVNENIFKRILFPNKNHSSLYKKLGNKIYYNLGDIKEKIQYKKRGS